MDYAPSPRHVRTTMDPPLVSRTPSPCFWKDDTSGVLLPFHHWLWNNHSPEAQKHGACYGSCDGERTQIEAAVSSSAERVPCPRCFFPFVPKKKTPVHNLQEHDQRSARHNDFCSWPRFQPVGSARKGEKSRRRTIQGDDKHAPRKSALFFNRRAVVTYGWKVAEPQPGLCHIHEQDQSGNEAGRRGM